MKKQINPVLLTPLYCCLALLLSATSLHLTAKANAPNEADLDKMILKDADEYDEGTALSSAEAEAEMTVLGDEDQEYMNDDYSDMPDEESDDQYAESMDEGANAQLTAATEQYQEEMNNIDWQEHTNLIVQTTKEKVRNNCDELSKLSNDKRAEELQSLFREATQENKKQIADRPAIVKARKNLMNAIYEQVACKQLAPEEIDLDEDEEIYYDEDDDMDYDEDNDLYDQD